MILARQLTDKTVKKASSYNREIVEKDAIFKHNLIIQHPLYASK